MGSVLVALVEVLETLAALFVVHLEGFGRLLVVLVLFRLRVRRLRVFLFGLLVLATLRLVARLGALFGPLLDGRLLLAGALSLVLGALGGLGAALLAVLLLLLMLLLFLFGRLPAGRQTLFHVAPNVLLDLVHDLARLAAALLEARPRARRVVDQLHLGLVEGVVGQQGRLVVLLLLLEHRRARLVVVEGRGVGLLLLRLQLVQLVVRVVQLVRGLLVLVHAAQLVRSGARRRGRRLQRLLLAVQGGRERGHLVRTAARDAHQFGGHLLAAQLLHHRLQAARRLCGARARAQRHGQQPRRARAQPARLRDQLLAAARRLLLLLLSLLLAPEGERRPPKQRGEPAAQLRPLSQQHAGHHQQAQTAAGSKARFVARRAGGHPGGWSALAASPTLVRTGGRCAGWHPLAMIQLSAI